MEMLQQRRRSMVQPRTCPITHWTIRWSECGRRVVPSSLKVIPSFSFFVLLALSPFLIIKKIPTYLKFQSKVVTWAGSLDQVYLADSACLTYSHKYIFGYTDKITELKLGRRVVAI